MKVLVTGGAGFIGSHVTKELLKRKHTVVVLDNLDPQVHGGNAAASHSLFDPEKVSFLQGDVTNADDIKRALRDVDGVIHLAATVGVGQSMYEILYYTHNNICGTATLYELLIKNQQKVQKVVVASSMSAYGEGLYHCANCKKNLRGYKRDEAALKYKQWDLNCPVCKGTLKPIGIPESEPFSCESIYALSKRDTEEIAMMLGRAHKIPTVALRFFNVYGPGQSLSNPYTGVMAIFLSRALNNQPPVIYEDGAQSRDFVHVTDLARAVVDAFESPMSDEVFNVGTGIATTVRQIADLAIVAADKKGKVEPSIPGHWRPGDIRYCFADNAKIKKHLGWQPRVALDEGVRELSQWCQKVQAKDNFNQASEELKRHGLLRTS